MWYNRRTEDADGEEERGWCTGKLIVLENRPNTRPNLHAQRRCILSFSPLLEINLRMGESVVMRQHAWPCVVVTHHHACVGGGQYATTLFLSISPHSHNHNNTYSAQVLLAQIHQHLKLFLQSYQKRNYWICGLHDIQNVFCIIVVFVDLIQAYHRGANGKQIQKTNHPARY